MKQKFDDFLKVNIDQINNENIEYLTKHSINEEFEDNLMSKIKIINNKNLKYNKSKILVKDYSKLILSSFIFIFVISLSLILFIMLQNVDFVNINSGMNYNFLSGIINTQTLIISFTFFVFIMLDLYVFNKKHKLH